MVAIFISIRMSLKSYYFISLALRFVNLDNKNTNWLIEVVLVFFLQIYRKKSNSILLFPSGKRTADFSLEEMINLYFFPVPVFAPAAKRTSGNPPLS